MKYQVTLESVAMKRETKGPFTNTCKGGLKHFLARNTFRAPFGQKKIAHPSLFFPKEIRCQPKRNAYRLNFQNKYDFSAHHPPLSELKKFIGPFLHQAPL